MQNISFLFGSGISIPANMPSTDEITKFILSGKNVNRETSDKFSIRNLPEDSRCNDYIPQVLHVIGNVKSKIDSHYYDYWFYKDKIATYEDIYYLVNEIYQFVIGEVDNPGLNPFWNQLKHEIKPILIGSNPVGSNISFDDILKQTLNYIHDITVELLDDKNKEIRYLDFISEWNNNSVDQDLNIFTLNHDLLLEKLLDSKSINYTDGFLQPDDETVRYWEPSLFELDSYKIKLFKLHGSVNWYRLRINDWFDEKTGIVVNGNVDRSKRDGITQFPPDNRPKMLIGTFNKLSQYTSSVFLDLYLNFHKKLSKSNKLIISGYGFQDKGINSRIIEWVYSNKGEILLIDPYVDELKEKCNGAISNKWNDWVKIGALKIINSGIEEIDYSDIGPYINQ